MPFLEAVTGGQVLVLPDCWQCQASALCQYGHTNAVVECRHERNCLKVNFKSSDLINYHNSLCNFFGHFSFGSTQSFLLT